MALASTTRWRIPQFALLPLLIGCDGAQSSLHPAGPAAERIAANWWLMFVLGAAVFLVVAVLAVAAVVRAPGVTRESPERPAPADVAHADDGGARRWIILGGIVVPLIIIPIVFVDTMRALAMLSPYRQDAELEIDVIGRQWWWEVRYRDPARGWSVQTANEIHIPVGRRVRVYLSTGDVIHTFWVPKLHGKLDMVPGKVNVLSLEASEPGVFRGQCAEFCGLQHANMAFHVVALPADQFEAWMERARQPAPAPGDEVTLAGRQAVERKCGLCHAIRGTAARGTVAPDLTHIGSRRSLAAGTLPNTRGHLAGWIANPQALKPGNLMPRVQLEPAELHAIVAYLESLR